MTFEELLAQLRTFRVPDDLNPAEPGNVCLLPEAAMASIYDCIVENELRDCLELGAGFGATSCVMAAAVAQAGGGRVVTVDRVLHEPMNARVLSERLRLGDRLEIVIDPLGYNWVLADLVARQLHGDTSAPLFDFCLLDGAHEFQPDALAFSLAAQLLKPGGWLVLDDLNYRFRDQPQWETTHPHLTNRELDTYQMTLVYDLFVRTHPDFTDFRVTHDGRLGWARKKPETLRDYARRLEGRVAELEAAHARLAADARSLDGALRSANPLKRRLRRLLRA